MPREQKVHKRLGGLLPLLMGAGVLGVSLLVALVWSAWRNPGEPQPIFTPKQISENLAEPIRGDILPNPLMMNVPGEDQKLPLRMNYTLDADLQAWGKKLVQMYHPDYAAIVFLDASTGAILSLVSYSEFPVEANLALQATFPAASIFKIVTAAAAVDQQILEPESVVTFHGSNHTLYRRNVYAKDENRWTRQMTLSDAFARSVNTVFGKIGMFMISASHLEEYGRRFLFNQAIATDIPVQSGRLQMPLSSEWERAEIASGFNRVSLMSPMQGALMAASIVNDGVMMRPYLVKSIRDDMGKRFYIHRPEVLGTPVRADTAESLRQMMQKTVQSGTSRTTFRDLLRKRSLKNVEFGGKTGSLMSLSPKGKCDWFVGYARAGKRRLAVSVMTIHGEFWRVKSSYLARAMFEQYLKSNPDWD